MTTTTTEVRLMGTGEVARALGLSERQLNYLIATSRGVPPMPLLAGRRVYGDQHVAALRAALAERQAARAARAHVAPASGVAA
jgi:hypothetical protein